jgi:ribosomal-protein-alanine N-acetyltransferase
MIAKDPFQHFPTLETTRLQLRQLSPADVDALYRIYSDPQVTEYYDLPTFRGKAEAAAVVRRAIERFRRREALRWGITLREANEVIGTVGLYFETSYRGGIGYDLARAYWRQGIMSEALRAVLSFAFAEAGLHRVQALVMPGNVASAQLLVKLGFAAEGILREYAYFQDAYQDLRCFSLLSDAFEPEAESGREGA